jgi:hypothetical protein
MAIVLCCIVAGGQFSEASPRIQQLCETVVASVPQVLLDYVALSREGMESGLKESATLFVAVVEDGYGTASYAGTAADIVAACVETASVLK